MKEEKLYMTPQRYRKKSQENAINSYISTNWKLRRSEHISRNSLPRLNQEGTI